MRSFGLGVTCALLSYMSLAAQAANLIQVPVPTSNGAFNTALVAWDNRSLPYPAELVWGISRVRVSGTGSGIIKGAFDYALNRLGSGQARTGTFSLYYLSKRSPTEIRTAGAALAVGFLAVMQGHTVRPGIALAGTVEPDGRIGPVGDSREIINTATREGYTTVLIPSGQLRDPRWSISTRKMTSTVTVQEVGSIDEAYFLMTGHHL
jgi:hypothetical protein